MDSSLNEKKLKNSRSINDHNSDLFSIHKVRGKHKDIPYNEVYFPKLQISPSYLNSNDIYRSNEMDAMWMVGVLDSSDRSRKNKLAKQTRYLRHLPESFSHPSTIDLNIISSKNKIQNSSFLSKTDSDPQRNMTEQEMGKLEALKHRLKKNFKKQNVSPYISTNKQLNHVLRHRSKHLKVNRISSTLVNKLFEINEEELVSATIIQKSVRRLLALTNMKVLSHLYRKARMIQSICRGAITQTWYRRWSEMRLKFIVVCQSMYRGYITRQCLRLHYTKEHKASSIIQSFARMYLGKCTFHCLKMRLSSTKIQCLWRSFVAKYNLAKLVLNQKTVMIQKHVRRVLATIFFKTLYSKRINSIICIQRCWRGFVARYEQECLLYNRMITTRKEQICLLTSEECFWSKKAKEIEGHSEFEDLKDEITKLNIIVNDAYGHIENSERIFLELQSERACLSPQAVGEGWDIELDKGIKEKRRRITEYKFEVLFGSGLKLRQAKEKLTSLEDDLNHANAMKSHFKDWREFELGQLWKRQQRYMEMNALRDQRMRIADERRKWEVKFDEGYKRNAGVRDARPSSSVEPCKTIDILIDNCKDQNWQNQFQLFQQLLVPITKVQSKLERSYLDSIANSNDKLSNNSDSESTIPVSRHSHDALL